MGLALSGDGRGLLCRIFSITQDSGQRLQERYLLYRAAPAPWEMSNLNLRPRRRPTHLNPVDNLGSPFFIQVEQEPGKPADLIMGYFDWNMGYFGVSGLLFWATWLSRPMLSSACRAASRCSCWNLFSTKNTNKSVKPWHGPTASDLNLTAQSTKAVDRTTLVPARAWDLGPEVSEMAYPETPT